jgi:hypothetical protein
MSNLLFVRNLVAIGAVLSKTVKKAPPVNFII